MDAYFPSIDKKTEIFFPRKKKMIDLINQMCTEEKVSFLIDKCVKDLFKNQLHITATHTKNVMTVNSGEQFKSWEGLHKILSFLVNNKQERNSPIVVIGGGSICDIGAFAASIYRRGIPLILIPTTLLSMIDASLGGKTAVNYKEGKKLYKNSIGTFYPASRIYCSSFWLQTLNKKEKISGIGELFKILWIRGIDPPLEEIKAWISCADPKKSNEIIETKLWHLIQKSIEIKIDIVKKDPVDRNGIREVLNYGHSLAHALESISNGKISHGEAVIWGMWIETDFFAPESKFSAFLLERIQKLGLKIPLSLQKVKSSDIEPYLKQDKKVRDKKLSIRALTDLGEIKKKIVHIEEFSTFSANKLNSS